MPGFQDFPRDYTAKYFDMLTAEEKLIDGNYDNMGRANESLDCRVYGSCAADIFLDSYTENLRLAVKAAGSNQLQLKEINHKFSILRLSKIAGIDKRFNEILKRKDIYHNSSTKL